MCSYELCVLSYFDNASFFTKCNSESSQRSEKIRYPIMRLLLLEFNCQQNHEVVNMAKNISTSGNTLKGETMKLS